MLDSLIQNLQNTKVKSSVSEHDGMYSKQWEEHYFAVGRSALTAIYTSLCARLNYYDGNKSIETVLDFGCGHGRVARYLKAAFPSARTYVSDLDKRGVAFCVKELDCFDAADQVFERRYDLIWLGSVFTHLPEFTTAELLTKLAPCLQPNGLLIFSSQGRFSVKAIERYLSLAKDRPAKAPYNLSADTLLDLLRGYYERGYGFANYPSQQNYGISLASPHWFQKHICASEKFLQILWQEKGWDAHQDVGSFIRADLEDKRKPNFYRSNLSSRV